MGARDANGFGFAVNGDIHRATNHNWLGVLGNLVAHGQVRIKVVFSVKGTKLLGLRIQRKSGAHSQVYGLFIEYRQGARQAKVDVVDQRIRRRFAGVVVGTGKKLGRGFELHMTLNANGRLVFASHTRVDHFFRAPKSFSAWRNPTSASFTSDCL